jgi:hypothetical protein
MYPSQSQYATSNAIGNGSQTYGAYSGGHGFGNPAAQVNGGTINGGNGMYYNPFGNSQF